MIDYAAEWAAMESLYAERGIGHRLGFGARPAVLVIDFIRPFTDPGHPLGSDLDVARDSFVPIFYTTVYYDEAVMEDSGIWGIKASGVLTLRADSTDLERDERLGARPEEEIVRKKYASAFFVTDLISRLNSRLCADQRSGRTSVRAANGRCARGCRRSRRPRPPAESVRHGLQVRRRRWRRGDPRLPVL